MLDCLWVATLLTIAKAKVAIGGSDVESNSTFDHDEPYGAIPQLFNGNPIKKCYLQFGDVCGCVQPKAWCSHCKCKPGYTCSHTQGRCIYGSSVIRQTPIDHDGSTIHPWECSLGEGSACQIPVKSLEGYCWCGQGLKCQNKTCVQMTAEEKAKSRMPLMKRRGGVFKSIKRCALATEGMECECEREGSFCRACSCKEGMLCHNRRCMWPLAARLMGGSGPNGELMPWDSDCRLDLDQPCQLPVRNRNGYCWCRTGLACINNVCRPKSETKQKEEEPKIGQQQVQVQQQTQNRFQING